MPDSLLPHGLSDALRQLALDAESATGEVVAKLGDICEAAAKRNVGSGGAHKAGTPTPARRGSGPAVITGDLRRAVTHEMVGPATVHVGPADIPHRAAKSGWKAPRANSGQIGKYVEDLGYVWLSPAVDEMIDVSDQAVGDALSVVRW